MADDIPIKDPYQFYNNRYLRDRNDEPPRIHSFSGEATTDRKQTRQKRKLKLLPVVNESGSDGRFVVTDSDKVDVKYGQNISPDSGNDNDGYLPAQLNVQDLLPEKQDGGKQLPSMGDVVIVTAHDSSVLGEMKVDVAAQSNPYNKINQKFHSALWFPGCIFLFFVFCVPAMMYMRRSDEAYAEHDFKSAKRNGTISTVFYAGGVLFALCFYAFVILLAIYLTGSY